MGRGQVKITKDDQEGMVTPESVAAWERNGWTRVDDGSSEQSAAPKQPDTNEEG